MSTVVYQETNNHFTSLDQTISDCQIQTVQVFLSDRPDINGDFDGQVGICLGGKDVTFHVWATKFSGWNEIALNLNEIITDEFVKTTKANNYSVYGQTILGNQVVNIMAGGVDPDHSIIKGHGQIYVNTNTEKVWISYGGFWYEITGGGEVEGVAKLDAPNDFTNIDQTIEGHPIATFSASSTPPPATNKKNGQLYLQISEGTGDKPKLFIGINHSQPALKQWEEVSYTLPNTVAFTSKDNDFQLTDQKISGKQILSFVDGGDQDPGQSKLPADYDGQFYIAVKTNPHGVKDAALWVAHGKQWLPALTVPEVDTSNFAKIGPSDSNNFQNIYQTIGAAAENRRVMTCRVKIGGHAPNADAAWVAHVNGEETLYVNGDEISLWKAMWDRDILNPPSHSYWRQIWPSIDSKNVAFLNRENIFMNRQFIDGPFGKKNFTVASRGSETPYNLITPYNVGDLYVQDTTEAGRTGLKLWVSIDNGHSQQWKAVYDSLFEEDRSARLDKMDKGITDNAAAINQNDHDIADLLIKFDGHQKDIEDINKELDAVDVRFDADVRTFSHISGAIPIKHGELAFVDKTPYFALQRGHADWARVLTSYDAGNTKSFDVLSEEHDALSAKVDGQEANITAAHTLATTANNAIEGHDERITSAHSHAQEAHNSIATHDTRIRALEDAPEYSLPSTVVHTNKASTMTEGLTLQTKPLVVKDTNYPRIELWMGSESASNGVRFGTCEMNDGRFMFVGKNDGHSVISKVATPVVGGASIANLISDQCSKFTDLETFKNTAEDDITDHETRITALEGAGGGEEVETLIAQVAALTTRLTELEAEVGTLKGWSLQMGTKEV